MRVFAVISLTITCAFSSTLFAEEWDSAIELLTQHEVRMPKTTARRDLERSPVVLVFDLEGDAGRSGIDRTLIEQAARNQLLAGRIESEVFDGDFNSAFLHGKLAARGLFSPKLVIAVEVEKEKKESSYSAKYTLAFIEYPKGSGISNHLLGSKVWSRHREVKGMSGDGLEDNLLQFVQSEASAWVRGMGSKYEYMSKGGARCLIKNSLNFQLMMCRLPVA